MLADLKNTLSELDGKAITLLSEAQLRYAKSNGFHDALIKLANGPTARISAAATWIIKAEIESGYQLTEEQFSQFIKTLPLLNDWAAILHSMQCISAEDATPSQARQIFDWALGYADHVRPFLRAWSVHVIVHIANSFAPLRAEARTKLNAALQDNAASVKARARKLRVQD